MTQTGQLATPTKRRRRWWYYAGLTAAGLFVFFAGSALVLGLYWSRLIATYTETQPKPVPALNDTPELMEALRVRFSAFQIAILEGKTPQPFVLTAGDLNTFFGQFPPLKNRLYFQLDNQIVQCQFCVPLGSSGRSKAKARYLNGIANLSVVYQDYYLQVFARRVEINGKPIPGWMLALLSRRNLASNLYNSWEAVEILTQIEKIQVKDGRVYLQPAPPNPALN